MNNTSERTAGQRKQQHQSRSSGLRPLPPMQRTVDSIQCYMQRNERNYSEILWPKLTVTSRPTRREYENRQRLNVI